MKKTIFSLFFLFFSSFPLLSKSMSNLRDTTIILSDDGLATMQIFFPESPCRMAIVCCPGGGYSHLSLQNEGTDWAEWFTSRNIVYGVLKYRMPKGDRNLPISDARNAIKAMHNYCDTVGIMGFSAGGHLASTVATHAEDNVILPDFQILFYPVISMNIEATHRGSVENFLAFDQSDPDIVKEYSSDQQVKQGETPPAIILLAGDDKAVPPLTNALAYYIALSKNNVNATLHIYPSGGHGFGFKESFIYHLIMLKDLDTWLENSCQ